MKKWKDYNFDLLKLIYKRDFFSSVTSKWWIALSVKAVWKTNLSIAVWPKKKLENYPLHLKYAMISVVCSFFTSTKKSQHVFSGMFTDGNALNWKTDGDPISKGTGQQSSLGRHTQKGETGKSHCNRKTWMTPATSRHYCNQYSVRLLLLSISYWNAH